MHQQIRTSPHDDAPFRDKLERRLRKLAEHKVNIEGVAAEPNSKHILFVVDHAETDAALNALAEWEPTTVPAFTKAIGHRTGSLDAVVRMLIEHGFKPGSVVVLASRAAGKDVLVSIGIDRYMTDDEWRDHGGWGPSH